MFINPKLKLSNIDNFIIRHSIYFCLKNSLEFLKGSLLDIGCGEMPYKEVILNNSLVNEYVGIDIQYAKDYGVKPDITWDGETMPLKNKSFDSVLCTEVLEHSYSPDKLIKEISRVLKDEGVALFSVPFSWNLHEVPYDFYRFTPFALDKLFMLNGFNVVARYRYGGWTNFFLQSLGCWLKRGSSSKLRKIFYPLVYLFISIRYVPPSIVKDLSEFKEGSQSVGFFYVVKKNK